MNRILGDGALIPPSPNDPHQVYVDLFKEAIQAAQEDPNDYWYAAKSATTLPLLMQRLQMQETLLQEQILQQMQMQMMMNPPPDQGKPGDKKKPSQQPPTPGGAVQGEQGGMGDLAA